MKIVLLESANAGDLYPEHRDGRPAHWPREAREADVVIALFAPCAPRILKGPDGLEVVELARRVEQISQHPVRWRWWWRRRQGGRSLEDIEGTVARERRNQRRRRYEQAARDQMSRTG